MIPPGVIVFGKKPDAAGSVETTGRNLNVVPVGYHYSGEFPSITEGESDADYVKRLEGLSDLYKPLGVSMDGIVDPAAAKANKTACGRYAAAVSGLVTLTAAVTFKDNNFVPPEMPKILSTLYVCSYDSGTEIDYAGKKYHMPAFSTINCPGFHKVGTVHWANDKFSSNGIAEVRVMLDLF